MAGIQSHYSINVAKLVPSLNDWVEDRRYAHHITIEPKVGIQRDAALEILMGVRELYPAPAFQVDMTYWECIGHRVDVPAEIEA